MTLKFTGNIYSCMRAFKSVFNSFTSGEKQRKKKYEHFDPEHKVLDKDGLYYKVWPPTQFFVCFLFVKASLIRLEGIPMTTCQWNAFLFRSYQQLPPCLRLDPLKDFLSWHSFKGPPSKTKKGHQVLRAWRRGPWTRHGQEQLTQNLDCLQKTHFSKPILDFEKSIE